LYGSGGFRPGALTGPPRATRWRKPAPRCRMQDATAGATHREGGFSF